MVYFECFEMNGREQDILQVFYYFDYFRHPLTAHEVWKYCHEKYALTDIEKILSSLVNTNKLVLANGYFALSTRKEITTERKANEKFNNVMLKRAQWVLPLLRAIPFIRGIGISGSLSKLGARPGADIDFFIITAQDRVWFVKAFAIMLKRLFFFNSHKYLCVNYLIAENALKLPKQNRYQAMEAITLKPLFGKNIFNQFFEQNNWISAFFPNAFPPCTEQIKDKSFLLTRILERIFSGNFGGKIEQMSLYEFRKHGLQKHKWHKGRFEYRKNSAAYFPNDFEQEVLSNYTKKTNNLAPIFQQQA